jgi:hypothetical protein
MLTEAFEYPLGGEETAKTLLIGGALVFGAALVVLPVIPMQGYLQAVLRSAVREESAPPAFDDWERLIKEGIVALVVVVAYGGVGAFAAVLGTLALTVALVLASAAGWGALGITGVAVGGLFAVAGAVVATAATYLFPAALARLALADDLGAAFEVRAVAHVAYDRTYLLAWLFVGTIGFALSFVSSVLMLVLVGFVAAFYVQVVSFYLFGRGYAAGAAACDDHPEAAATAVENH